MKKKNEEESKESKFVKGLCNPNFNETWPILHKLLQEMRDESLRRELERSKT